MPELVKIAMSPTQGSLENTPTMTAPTQMASSLSASVSITTFDQHTSDSHNLNIACGHGSTRLHGQHAQLDHIIINTEWLNSVRNCRACRTVEIGSDHRIVSVTIKIRLRIQGANLVKRKRFDWKMLDHSQL